MTAISDDVSVPLELNTSVRLPKELVDQIDALRASWRPPLSRGSMIRVLLEEALAAREVSP